MIHPTRINEFIFRFTEDQYDITISALCFYLKDIKDLVINSEEIGEEILKIITEVSRNTVSLSSK